MSGAFGDMGNLLKQAQRLQRELEKAREEVRQARVTGTAGGGAVSVEADGEGAPVAVRIRPEVLAGAAPAMLEDLVLTAARDAFARATTLREERMSRVSGGLNLPGIL